VSRRAWRLDPGQVIKKSLPRPGPSLNMTRPPLQLHHRRTSVSPTRARLSAIGPLVALDGQSTWPEQARRNAIPVSATRDRLILFPPTRMRIVPPGEVYLIAFVNRLATIWFRRVGSAFAQTARPNVDDVSLEASRARQVTTERWTAGRQVQGLARQDDVAAGEVGDGAGRRRAAQMGDLVRIAPRARSATSSCCRGDRAADRAA